MCAVTYQLLKSSLYPTSHWSSGTITGFSKIIYLFHPLRTDVNVDNSIRLSLYGREIRAGKGRRADHAYSEHLDQCCQIPRAFDNLLNICGGLQGAFYARARYFESNRLLEKLHCSDKGYKWKMWIKRNMIHSLANAIDTLASSFWHFQLLLIPGDNGMQTS